MRYVDLQAARQVDERLAEQLDVLAELRENDAEAARLAASDISMRLDGLAGAAHAETAAVRAIAESVGAQVADAQRQRLEDLAASELAGAELAALIDDLAVRSAESAVAVEHALRDELGALAARIEGHDVDEIEAREELRGELERLASSMGWRLERIEESLASDDSAVLRETVADSNAGSRGSPRSARSRSRRPSALFARASQPSASVSSIASPPTSRPGIRCVARSSGSVLPSWRQMHEWRIRFPSLRSRDVWHSHPRQTATA